MVNKKYLTEVVLLTKTYNLTDFKDWLHWHLDIIGFDHCHIFDNESTVDIKSVCDQYGDKVSYEKIIGWPNQYSLYNRYINDESKSWWVLPIDDDEYLYVSDKYRNKINNFFIESSFVKSKKPHKICIGWRNLFPEKYTTERKNPHLVLNSIGYSDSSSNIWQFGNRPVKTFLLTTIRYNHCVINGIAHTHNPIASNNELGISLNSELLSDNLQKFPTRGDEDLLLFHYQFKCDDEWKWKCKNRKSPGGHWNKDFPNKYRELYNFNISLDRRAADLWYKK